MVNIPQGSGTRPPLRQLSRTSRRLPSQGSHRAMRFERSISLPGEALTTGPRVFPQREINVPETLYQVSFLTYAVTPLRGLVYAFYMHYPLVLNALPSTKFCIIVNAASGESLPVSSEIKSDLPWTHVSGIRQHHSRQISTMSDISGYNPIFSMPYFSCRLFKCRHALPR